MKLHKGFTLIELLVVIAIMAILASISVALFNTAQENVRDGKRRADIDAISSALEAHFANGLYPTTIDPLWFESKALPTGSGSYYYSYPSGGAAYIVCSDEMERGSGGNFSDQGTTPAAGGLYYCRHSQQ